MLIEKKKKTNKPYSSCTITTGDIGYNISQFNKHNGTDFEGNDNNNPSTVEAGGADAALGEGCCEELSLHEGKRYVRRYYIRPQNIFCSNKNEILKALIDYQDDDCTVYTLNNLTDNDDITKLSPKDVIYYYEDGILYDKNRVRIMDYDLKIKHEEERRKINAEKASDSTLKSVYDDRMTEVSDLDEAFNLDFEAHDAYGRTLFEGRVVNDTCCICGEDISGYGNNAEPIKTGVCCDACNLKFVIPARLAAMADHRGDTK